MRGRRYLRLTIFTLFVFLICLPCRAATITVPDDYPVIQDAINAAFNGDTVAVRAGTWSGDGNVDLELRGKSITLTSVSGPWLTIIDCGGSLEENHRGIHFNGGEGPDTVVSGFTITGGFAWEGGGILCEDSAPTITGNIITGNDAEFRGGGIALLHDCDAVVDDNLFTGNRVVSSSGWGNSGGGGLSAEFCSPTITNNRFIGNSCGSRGGGLHGLDLENPVLHNNLVAHNHAAQAGGGWNLSTDTAATISHCTFVGNTCTLYGQGLYCRYSGFPQLVENCIFWGNGAPGDPQLYAGTGTTIAYSTVQGGEAAIEGPGTHTWGPAAFDIDPLFVSGPLGDYFLSHIAAGQPEDSFCIDRGNPAGPIPAGTTRTDLAADTLWPDMGYHYTVPVRDLLQVDPAEMLFTVEAGTGSPLPQTLTIWNGGPDTMDWSVSENADWLTLDPLSGESITGELDPVTVTVDADNLLHGNYSAAILVEAPGSLGAPLTIPVELRVTETFAIDAAGGGDFTTVRGGLDAALPGDTLLLSPGTYSGPLNRDLQIDTGDITIASTHGPDKTVIDCQGQGRGFTFDVEDPDMPVTLSGITIANGTADTGGGILCSGETSLALDGCRITGCQTTGDGGGIHVTGLCAPLITDTWFFGNSAGGSGGGVSTAGFTLLRIENCTVENNTAGEHGGGVAGLESAELRVTASTVRENLSDFSGGGISHGGDDRALFSGNLVQGNMADGSYGGGISASSYVEVVTTDNVIDGNRARFGGGFRCSGTFINNLVINNVADDDGGGTTTGEFGSITIESCTFFNNTAVDSGGGLESYEYGRLKLRNCILWNNHAPRGHEIYAAGDYAAEIDYCDVDTTGEWAGGAGGYEWGVGNLEVAPLFAQGPLGTFYLSQQAAGQPQTSPCVDAGDPLSELLEGTTRTDGLPDDGTIDIGYHYPVTDGPFICSQPAQFAFGTTPGVPPPDQGLAIWRCGTGTLGWAVSAGQTWVMLTPSSGSSSGEVDFVAVGIDPTGLVQGEYLATITISNPGGDAPPVTVPVTLTVGEPLIEFSPASFSYSVQVNEAPPPTDELGIWQGGSGVLHWNVSEDASWLDVSPLSGSSTGEIDLVEVAVDHTGLPFGLYEATITIESPNALNSPQEVPVHLRVDEFIISHYPLQFAFSAQAGGPPPPDERLRIHNAGSGTMAWELSCEADWVTFDIASGKVSDGTSRVWIGADPTLLEPGLYQADLVLTAKGASNTPAIIPVYLLVELDGLVTGPGPAEANPPLVRLFPPVDGAQPFLEFSAYGATQFGVNVNVAELDMDGFDEILTGAGPGEIYGPHVRGFESDGTPLPGLSFLAYGTNKFGVNVAGGELDGDGFNEIITGAGPGAVFGPHVRGWNYDGGPGVSAMPGINFMAYGTPKWGVNVAVGDIDGDNVGEIITGPGPGTVYGPHVRGWDVVASSASPMSDVSFMAYGTNKYGVNVTAGDVDGDGIDEVVTGAGPGMVFGPHVRGWNYDGSAVTPLPGYSFFAWQTAPLTHGVNVFAGTDLDGDGRDELVTGRGPAPDADTEVKVFTYDGTSVIQWFSLEAYPGLSQGTNVAAGNF